MSLYIFQEFPTEAMSELYWHKRLDQEFECYHKSAWAGVHTLSRTAIYRKTQSLTKVVNFMFWPIACIVVCWSVVIVLCYRRFIRKVDVTSTFEKRLSQFQMACEEGNVENLSKYLVSHHLKTPLDSKCNLQHFRKNPTVDINDRNSKNSSALGCAFMGRKFTLISKSNLECIELLLVHGADVQNILSLQPRENLPDGVACILLHIYSKKHHLKWYALATTRILMAAGYELNSLGEKKLIHLFLTESLCASNVNENKEEYFMRNWGFEMFSQKGLIEALDTLNIDINDFDSECREKAADFLSFVTTAARDIRTLQHLCRIKVRKILMESHPNRNLYFLVSQTPLSINVIRYLLFDLQPPKPSYYDYTAINFEESFV